MANKKQARRIGYLRWRIRNSKDMKPEDMAELKDYVAATNGVDRKALDTLSSASIDALRKMTVEQLEKLAHALGLISIDEKVTKGELTSRLDGFRKAGFTNR